jgi:hypothetical protein
MNQQVDRCRPQPSKYGLFEARVNVTAGQTSPLPCTIWMPRIDTAHAVRIPPPTLSEVVLTTPYIPGLEVRLPPNTVIRDGDGQPVREVSITPIPVDRHVSAARSFSSAHPPAARTRVTTGRKAGRPIIGSSHGAAV